MAEFIDRTRILSKVLMQLLKVYQIYYNDTQLHRVEYIPYNNAGKCTVFFENSVIRELIEHNEQKDAEYFGVISYKLREKIDFLKRVGRKHPHLINQSIMQFSPLQFEHELKQHRPDVLSFQRHLPHDPIALADRYHPQFSFFFKDILKRIGFEWNHEHYTDVIYCNHFVAKSSIYEHYVKTMLIPAMEAMKQMPELYQNSGYPHQLPEELKKSFGVDYFPYHAFLCERFFSFYIKIHNLTCLHY